jgi:hypothetical protein
VPTDKELRVAADEVRNNNAEDEIKEEVEETLALPPPITATTFVAT